MKKEVEDLALVYNFTKEEIEDIFKKIESGEINVDENNNLESDLKNKSSKNILGLIRKNKTLRYAIMSLALLFKVSDSFGAKSTEQEMVTKNTPENQTEMAMDHNLNTEPNPDKTYFMGRNDDQKDKAGPEEYIIPDLIKLNIYNKYIIDKAELADAKQVKIDVQKFLNEINLTDLQGLDDGQGVDMTITSGASPEKTNSWNLVSFDKFISDNSINIDVVDMEKFALEAEKYADDQKGNYWLSLARGFFLQKMILESLQDLADKGDIKAQYLLANGNFIVENFPTSEQDFKSAKSGQSKENRIYQGDNPKFYKENGEGMTWAEIRNSLVEIKTGEKRIIKENNDIKESPILSDNPSYEIIKDLDTKELEKIIKSYNFVIFDKSESMKETVPKFFINELKKNNKKSEIEKIQKNMQGNKEVKNDKINTKSFGTIVYAGVENIENTYCLQEDGDGDIINIMSKLNYNGYAERQINLLNESLKNIYKLIEEAEKSPEKCSSELKLIMKSGKIKGCIFTDEQIKYSSDHLAELEDMKRLFSEKGYEMEIDIIFADKIGRRDSQLIKVDMETMMEMLKYLAEKQPNKKIINLKQVNIENLGNQTSGLQEVREESRKN